MVYCTFLVAHALVSSLQVFTLHSRWWKPWGFSRVIVLISSKFADVQCSCTVEFWYRRIWSTLADASVFRIRKFLEVLYEEYFSFLATLVGFLHTYCSFYEKNFDSLHSVQVYFCNMIPNDFYPIGYFWNDFSFEEFISVCRFRDFYAVYRINFHNLLWESVIRVCFVKHRPLVYSMIP